MNRKPLFSRLKYDPIEAIALSNFQQEALQKFRYKLDKGLYGFEEVPCLCGQTNNILVAEKDRYGLRVNTYCCKNCGMMWTNPRMTEKSLAQFYNEDYRSIYVGSPQAPDDFFEEQVTHGKQIYKFVISEFNNKDNLTIFDIGCGAGGILIPFRDEGCLTYGCDMGSEYLKKGREEGLILEDGDENSLRKYKKADLIILSHVLEHFSDPLKTLRSIADLLATDGYIYIELPGIFKIHETYGDILLFLQNAHLYHFTLKTLTYIMNQMGFKFVKGNDNIYALYQKQNNIQFSLIRQNQFLKIIFYLYLMAFDRILPILSVTRKIKINTIKLIKSIIGKRLTDLLKQKFKYNLL